MAVVEELDEETGIRWNFHIGTNVDARTKARLCQQALEEMTSASAIVRRAIVRELERAEREEA